MSLSNEAAAKTAASPRTPNPAPVPKLVAITALFGFAIAVNAPNAPNPTGGGAFGRIRGITAGSATVTCPGFAV